ncbi:YfhO family protein [Candidatus Gottesmanbacteria bacterium]|nr:YfhO family protein [Candidatus Gottesmanbacteria bacterium]
MKIIKLHLLPILGILFFWFLYFSKIFLFNHVFYSGDNNSISITFNQFFVDSVKTGELPLWNPYILSGIPFFLPTNLLIFPLSFLFFITKAETALTLNMVSIYLTAGIGMYFFSFSVYKNRLAAFYSSLVYMLSGLVAKNSVTYITVISAAYMPWIFWLALLSIKKKNILYCAICGIIIAFNYFSGHPMYIYITLLGLVIFVFFGIKQGFITKTKYLLALIIFAFGFSSVMLFPQIEASRLSTRSVKDFTYTTQTSLNSKDFITIILPHAFGVSEIELRDNRNNYLYLGILPAIFALFAIISKNSQKNKISVFILLSVIGLILSLGRNTFVYKLTLLIPGLGLFRQPLYFVLLYVFSVSVICGVGFNHFIRSYPHVKIRFLSAYKISVRILLYVLIILSLITYIILRSEPILVWQKFIPPHFVSRASHIKNIGIISFENLVFLLVLIVISLNMFRKTSSKQILIVIVFIVTFIDLFYLNSPEFLTTSQKNYQRLYSANVPEYLSDPNIKIASYVSPTLQNWDNFNRQEFLFKRTIESEKTLSPNRNSIYGVFSVFGFSPLSPKSYTDYLNEKHKQLLVGISDSDISIDNPVLSQSGAGYILTNYPIFASLSQFNFIGNTSTNTYLYKNNLARPRAFLVEENGNISKANIKQMTANSVTVKYNSTGSAKLVLLDNYYPGWEAEINGNKVDVEPFENVFRSVKVPKGQNILIFRYNPKSFKLGVYISLTTVLIFIGLIKFKLNGKKRHS